MNRDEAITALQNRETLYCADEVIEVGGKLKAKVYEFTPTHMVNMEGQLYFYEARTSGVSRPPSKFPIAQCFHSPEVAASQYSRLMRDQYEEKYNVWSRRSDQIMEDDTSIELVYDND